MYVFKIIFQKLAFIALTHNFQSFFVFEIMSFSRNLYSRHSFQSFFFIIYMYMLMSFSRDLHSWLWHSAFKAGFFFNNVCYFPETYTFMTLTKQLWNLLFILLSMSFHIIHYFYQTTNKCLWMLVEPNCMHYL